MNNRIYNILFNTHTISGIVISVALYVIFFAGSFSFFRSEIAGWERNEPVEAQMFENMDFDGLIDTLGQRYSTYGRDITIRHINKEQRVTIDMTGSKDSLASEEAKLRKYFFINVLDFNEYEYQKSYSLAEFLYRLHFFAQLNFYGTSGYLLAGLVAFFFLFAIITGVWVHWNKIISNFYLLRPRAKLKTLWTDAHTALGVLGLPYQFIFAVTGIYLIVGTAVMAPPVVSLLYNNNTEKLYNDMGFAISTYPLANKKLDTSININAFIERTKAEWGDFELRSVALFNYGDAHMHVSVEGGPLEKFKFAGKGHITYQATTGAVVSQKSPYEGTSYLDGATEVLRKLHFGDYGGLGLRIIYFILGIVSCFVIISGVMIWLVARDKKSTPNGQRRFNAWVVWIYLSVCLSMYPVTALTFLVAKVFPPELDSHRMVFIFRVFFYSWLALSVLLAARRDNFLINKYTLLGGSIIGLLVPIANGITTGNWIWKTFVDNHYQVFVVDAFWLALSTTTLVIALKLKRKVRDKEAVHQVSKSSESVVG
ncbi:PepSY-associated TM helix domain-containing protein [Parapedobacter tibetensis]|uniref:PepSY-associated TM helix domain-containing protein n=1 Tax=Parapedobacter tibetensis TaxID=2972951 RepID=UPI00214DC0FE|nr:PepSY-associated TM helix domain-containing protein [Parapedobacter tibetensis]